jgi:hypothetical protein
MQTMVIRERVRAFLGLSSHLRALVIYVTDSLPPPVAKLALGLAVRSRGLFRTEGVGECRQRTRQARQRQIVSHRKIQRIRKCLIRAECELRGILGDVAS